MRISKIVIHSFKGLKDITLNDCGVINAVVGKNNSGKSSILHAINIACLAIEQGNWNKFQPKIEIKDLINDVGEFKIEFTFEDGRNIEVKSNQNLGPITTGEVPPGTSMKSLLVFPDVGMGLLRREQKTPKNILDAVERNDFNSINSIEILYAIKYYSDRKERGLTPENYQRILGEISKYFLDIEKLDSDISENHIPTLTYREYGKDLDILYSGTGLKHFLDILVKTTLSGANIILIDEPELGLHPELQRQFFEYLDDYASNEEKQIFLATHSQVILNFGDFVTFYRILNSKGARKLIRVEDRALEIVLGDLGIRGSDIFNHDICLMVEGQDEVIFWEHIIRKLYATDFEDVAIGIIQYGGSNVTGIVNGTIEVSNIVSSQKFTYWIHDRDKPVDKPPSREASRLKERLDKANIKCRILNKRELEYYYPETVLVAAQDGDKAKEKKVIDILRGDQSHKFRTAAKGLCVPRGKSLKKLLEKHFTKKKQLDNDLNHVIRDLKKWRKDVLGIS